MKKTIFALFVLSYAGSAGESVSLLPELTSITDLSTSSVSDTQWIGGKDGSTTETLISAEAIANNITSSWGSSMQSTGWYGGTANLNTGTTIALTVKENGNGFSFTERGAYGGTFVMASIEIADLLGGKNGTAESFTLSFNAESSTLNFSAWSWNGTTASALVDNAGVSTSELNSYSVDVIPEDSRNLLFFFHGTGYGATASVTNLTAAATVNTIPEPATATLSLLALCGLVSRRRRK